MSFRHQLLQATVLVLETGLLSSDKIAGSETALIEVAEPVMLKLVVHGAEKPYERKIFLVKRQYELAHLKTNELTKRVKLQKYFF